MNDKVLVVDDDPAILKTVSRILEKKGIPVITADSGESCLELIRSTGFKGLVLLDVIMKDMDGWDTIRVLAEEKMIDGLLICMLTGEHNPNPKMDYLKEYVVDYVTKPFDLEELYGIVKNYYTHYLHPNSFHPND